VKFSLADPRLRALLYQLAAMGAALFVAWYLISNTLANLAELNIATGFRFLQREAGFEIGERTLFTYSAADTYLRALGVGSPTPSVWR